MKVEGCKLSFFVLPLFCFSLVVYGLAKLIQTITLLGMGGPFQSPLSKDMGLKHWVLLKDHFNTHLFFFQFLGGGTLLSLDLGPKGVSNL